MDYDDLIKDMKKDMTAANEYRLQNGYGRLDLIGWASEPYYDAESKKLHWAKELHFEGEESNTLNYNIRVLGRKGVLQLNFISEMQELPLVKAEIPTILPSVDFNSGYQYREFDPKLDKIAAVGIGGLIAGKVLAKTGILVVLAKFGKFIIAGVLALGVFLRKLFMGNR
jgi:uncharacterized membrane-anchored protein